MDKIKKTIRRTVKTTTDEQISAKTRSDRKVELMKCLQTLNGRAFPRVFWMPFRAVATDTGVDRTVWMAAETACNSW